MKPVFGRFKPRLKIIEFGHWWRIVEDCPPSQLQSCRKQCKTNSKYCIYRTFLLKLYLWKKFEMISQVFQTTRFVCVSPSFTEFFKEVIGGLRSLKRVKGGSRGFRGFVHGIQEISRELTGSFRGIKKFRGGPWWGL